MYMYKVILGTRRYTTEKIEYVQAKTIEEACNIAMRKHRLMRYAVARKER